MPHLPLLDKILHRAGNIFHRHIGIDAMLIEQVDYAGFEALQSSVSDGSDPFRGTIQTLARYSIFEAELRSNNDLVANWSERLTDKFFICERAVSFRGVEERHTAVIGSANHLDGFTFFGRGAISEAESHAAEAERGNF